MRPKDQTNWMLSDAIEALARAERLHQSFLNLHPRAGGSEPSWEPPMDVIETEQEILILVALPGVDPDQVEAGRILAQEPQAMQLRYFAALHDIAGERSSTVVFPLPMNLLDHLTRRSEAT